MPGCESRSLPDSRPEMRARPPNASSTSGRRRGPASLRSRHGGRRAQTGPGSPADATKTREPSRSWRRTRNSPRHPRDRGARSDDPIRDLTIAATHIPHGIASHRAGSPASAGPAHNARSWNPFAAWAVVLAAPLRGRVSNGAQRSAAGHLRDQRGGSFGGGGSTTTMTLPAGLPSSTSCTAAAPTWVTFRP